MINYIKDDLFNAPPNSLLLHSCNCKGVWGAGIALKFKSHRRGEFIAYEAYSKHYKHNALGTALVINDVVCLYTSEGYGNNLDSKYDILQNTRNSINFLLSITPVREFHLPKINSGLFKVPWENTEKILLEFPEVTWNVYSLE